MNQPDINKKHLGVLLPLDLVAKVRRYAEEHQLTITEVVTIALNRHVDLVELTADDIDWIAQQVRRNEILRSRRRI